MNKHRAFVALGSNKGNKIKYLKKALKLIDEHPEISLVKHSYVYETEPFGYKEQENFLNMVAEISTKLEPLGLLRALKEIEKQLGRKPSFKWGPREIDLDILLLDEISIQSNELTVPHPYLLERDFFLKPLLELDNELIFPVSKKKLKDYLNLIETNHIINKFNINSFPR